MAKGKDAQGEITQGRKQLGVLRVMFALNFLSQLNH